MSDLHSLPRLIKFDIASVVHIFDSIILFLGVPARETIEAVSNVEGTLNLRHVNFEALTVAHV